ncbi:hypothetical protein [Echinicola sp. 20G]|uniref:TRADD-N-associated membrane domain-containing protein n=1 Tax=Echinicola sp. 20G TaxID=2781961 RepID=UPI00191034CF|nr:hypothetical protein [Echinicola sp. 20G]
MDHPGTNSNKRYDQQKLINMAIGFALLVALIVGAWLLSKYVIDAIESQNMNLLFKIIGFIVFLVPGIFFYLYLAKAGKKDNLELKSIHEERQEIKGEIKDKSQINVIDSIRLSLNRLQEYYTINTSQARRSFTFSLIAIVTGLGVLIIGILYFYVDSKNVTLTAISSISGVLIQFIGGAYFLMYKKSLTQLNYFYQQLIINQNTMLAINLTDSISDEAKSIEMKQKIIEALLKKSIDEIESINTISPTTN